MVLSPLKRLLPSVLYDLHQTKKTKREREPDEGTAIHQSTLRHSLDCVAVALVVSKLNIINLSSDNKQHVCKREGLTIRMIFPDLIQKPWIWILDTT